MRLKSRNTWASGQTGCRLHAWSILQGGKTPLFFYKMAFSYIFDPLLAVITTHHTVNLHFSPLPACPPVTCMCRLCLCVCGFSGSFNPSSRLNTYLCQRSQIHFSPDMLIPLMNLRYCKCLTESLRGSECDGADGQTNIGGGKIIWAADSRHGSANYVYSSQSKDVGAASGLSEHFVFASVSAKSQIH